MKRILILLLLILIWFVCIGDTRTSKSSSGVYVFGSITGTILAEAEEASIDEVIDSCKTLKVSAGAEARITTNVSYCNIVFGDKDSKLIIDSSATLTITNDISINTGQLINHGIIESEYDFSIYPTIYNDQTVCQFNNTGVVVVDNFILGDASSQSKIADSKCFNFSCSSAIVANDTISFTILGGTGDLELLGNYKANHMIVDYQSGGAAVNFGKTCGDSRVELKTLTFKNNISQVNIKEFTKLENINVQTHSTIKMSVTGELVVGRTTGQIVSFTGATESILRLCYNPTHNSDFRGNGQTTSTSGLLIYRYDINDSVHSWYTNGSKNDPIIEEDVLCINCKKEANSTSFEECMNGEIIILGIEEEPKNEIHFKSNRCNYCSDRYKRFTIQIDSRCYRVITGVLIYCENDN